MNRVERVHALNCLALEELTQTPNAWFLDLDSLVGIRGSVCANLMELAKEHGAHAEMLARMRRDEVWSAQRLREMVNLDSREGV